MSSRRLDKYLRSRPLPLPWALAGIERGGFAAAVVIPALAEHEYLFDTLASLAANPADHLQRTLIVVVVNHRADAPDGDKADNARLLARLAAGDSPHPLQLAWVDAASPGLELPSGEGVGLARKIGFDLALARLDWQGGSFLASLDADTLVEPTYLAALSAHFVAATGGAVLPFRHRPAQSAGEDAAIRRYELYLRGHVLGLSLADSPYAFHTVGSALACRAEAYLTAGGMNRRRAGEDFYFLQQLAKTSGVARLAGTIVHPSPRRSFRTPFGTGRSVARQIEGEEEILLAPADAYRRLGAWLALAAGHGDGDGATLLTAAARHDERLADFLEEAGLVPVWERLRRQHRTPRRLLRAFHGWFDALKGYRLLQHLEPKRPVGEALPDLLAWAGLPAVGDPLELLRGLQGAGN
ncbi:MAG TPA: glycosyltransferase family A protein [Desulfuromonadales bacterium]|nr:glycosyltransferase family A protein [Desulfuromonadales bacterium]